MTSLNIGDVVSINTKRSKYHGKIGTITKFTYRRMKGFDAPDTKLAVVKLSLPSGVFTTNIKINDLTVVHAYKSNPTQPKPKEVKKAKDAPKVDEGSKVKQKSKSTFLVSPDIVNELKSIFDSLYGKQHFYIINMKTKRFVRTELPFYESEKLANDVILSFHNPKEYAVVSLVM